jgi:hypothetical protein
MSAAAVHYLVYLRRTWSHSNLRCEATASHPSHGVAYDTVSWGAVLHARTWSTSTGQERRATLRRLCGEG